MANVTVQSILFRASTLLQDITNIRWPQAELLEWLISGQREIVLFKPNASVKNVDFALAAGAKQTIPNDGLTLVDIPRNSSGLQAITLVSRQILDAQVPGWSAQAKSSATTIHYCYSPNDPKHFYVYPPSPGGNSVEIIYNANPSDATLNGSITIDDIYESPLVDYIVYRAYSKDAEYAVNADNARKYCESFQFAIKGKYAAEALTNPNAQAKGNPNVV